MVFMNIYLDRAFFFFWLLKFFESRNFLDLWLFLDFLGIFTSVFDIFKKTSNLQQFGFNALII